MTADNHIPELFWISGSPPSWRVMLVLEAKGIDYKSVRLDTARNENRTPEYISVNPRGQVPTLRHGSVIVRESIAILAYIEARWKDHPVFGATPEETAAIWQILMDFESNLRPAITVIAQVLLRGTVTERYDELLAAVNKAQSELDLFEELLSDRPYLAGEIFTVADCALYPGLAWVKRARQKASGHQAIEGLSDLLECRKNLNGWQKRIEAKPFFDKTVPPHWRD